MILRRLGNKKAIAHKIIPHFPEHKIYIEPFFGAGGMFFNKSKAKYNIVNDLDSDVFNLFNVVSTQPEELKYYFKLMPIHSDLWEYWKVNKETNPIRKALRFLFLSNFGYMGKTNTLRYNNGNSVKILYEAIDKTNEYLFGVEFMNCECSDMFSKISLQDNDQAKTFIYCAPPYLGTTDNYSNSFTQQDSADLLDTLGNTGCKWAMSEFDQPFILEQAKERNLNVITIGERVNLKNRRTEILVTNYDNRQKTLFKNYDPLPQYSSSKQNRLPKGMAS